MAGTKVSFDEVAAGKTSDDLKHDRSSINFPYLDLNIAVGLAKAIHSRAGFSGCGIDEVAAEMKQTVSGAFRLKIATAKIFGLIEKESRGQLKLSDLGQKIVSPDTETEGEHWPF